MEGCDKDGNGVWRYVCCCQHPRVLIIIVVVVLVVYTIFILLYYVFGVGSEDVCVCQWVGCDLNTVVLISLSLSLLVKVPRRCSSC